MSDDTFPSVEYGGFSDYSAQNQYFVGVIHGYSAGASVPLLSMTGSNCWFIIHVESGRQSASIARSLKTEADVFTAIQAQLDAMPYWNHHRTLGDIPPEIFES